MYGSDPVAPLLLLVNGEESLESHAPQHRQLAGNPEAPWDARPEQAGLLRNLDNPGLDKFHVHVRCFAAWEFERNKQPSP